VRRLPRDQEREQALLAPPATGQALGGRQRRSRRFQLQLLLVQLLLLIWRTLDARQRL
jgi:hypothetical protein